MALNVPLCLHCGFSVSASFSERGRREEEVEQEVVEEEEEEVQSLLAAEAGVDL